jgi:MFS family permease
MSATAQNSRSGPAARLEPTARSGTAGQAACLADVPAPAAAPAGGSAPTAGLRSPAVTASQPSLSRPTSVAILLCISGIYFMSYFQRVAVPGTVFDEVQMAFGLSASGVAALGSIYLYLYGCLQPLAGILSDSWGAGRTILLSGLLLSVGALAFPCAGSVGVLYLTRAAVGVGAAMAYVSMTKEVDELFGEREFPFFVGIGLVLGYSGGLFGTYPFARLVQGQGWRRALLEVGVVGVLAWLAALVLLRRTGRLGQRTHAGMGGWVKVVLRNPGFLTVTASGSINFAVYFLLQATLGKKFLQDTCGVPSGKAAAFTFTMMLVCMLCIFLAGLLARHSGRRRPFMLLASLLTLTATIMLVIGISSSVPQNYFLLCYALLAAASGLGVIYTSAAKEMNPRAAAGTSIGLLNTGAYLAVALLTSLAGMVLDAYDSQAARTASAVLYPREAYRAVFALCVALAAVSCICAWRVRERAPGHQAADRGAGLP